MGSLVDAQLREDLLDVGAAHEELVVEDGDGRPVGEDPEVRVLHLRVEAAQLGFVVLEDDRVLHRDQAVVHVLGERPVPHGVEHEPPGDVDLAHRAASPGDDLGGEHGAHAGLLRDGEEQGVHPGGVGAGELGDIPDPHQLPRLGVAPVGLGVALERCREPEADRLDDRVDEIADPPPLERLDRRGQGLDPLPEVGDGDYPCAAAGELASHLAVRPVDAQHQLRPGLHGGADLGRLEAVDADPHPRAAELPHDVTQRGERHARRAADVDDVGAAGLEIIGRRADRFARQLGRVVDLGQDLDVVRAVVDRGERLAEVAGNLPQVFRALLHAYAEALGQDARLALDQAGQQDQLGARRHLEEACDPGRRHQRRHRDLEDGDLGLEPRPHLLQHAPERRLGEPPGDEQDFGWSFRSRRYRGSPGRTHLFGVPSRAPPVGRQRTTSSILRASSKSLSLIPPAA